jgi:hypothetical protein
MMRGGEIINGVPILDQAAAELRAKGQFRQYLRPADLQTLTYSVVDSLLTQQSKFQLDRQRSWITTEINRNPGYVQGVVRGSVQVRSPLDATIGLAWTLANAQPNPDGTRTRIATIGLSTTAETHGGMGFLASMAMDVQGEVQSKAAAVLGDPNMALWNTLYPQLWAKGALVTSQALQFMDNDTLMVELRGQPRR